VSERTKVLGWHLWDWAGGPIERRFRCSVCGRRSSRQYRAPTCALPDPPPPSYDDLERDLAAANARAAASEVEAQGLRGALQMHMLRWVCASLLRCDGCREERAVSEQEYIDRQLATPFEHRAGCALVPRAGGDGEGTE
jgi:hypothetical protein